MIRYQLLFIMLISILNISQAKLRVIVKYKNKSSKYFARTKKKNNFKVLKFSGNEDEKESFLEKLSNNSNIEKIQVDQKMFIQVEAKSDKTPDPLSNYQWHFFDKQYGISLSNAWEITQGSKEVVVAVLDTGIINHKDLNEVLLPGADLISDIDVSNDGDGRDQDPEDPGDWISESDDCYQGLSQSSTWHGTHVAGTISAKGDNGLFGSGVTWNTKILPVRVLGKCGGYISDIADGIRWAVGISVNGVADNKNPAQVINLSLGAFGSCPEVLQSAIDEARSRGASIIAAAGNSYSNISIDNFAPANCNGVITVAATNNFGDMAYYSNYGSSINISAPGGEDGNGVWSTSNNGTEKSMEDNFKEMSGTSMAAPHVSGVVALILAMNKNLTTGQVLNILQQSSSQFSVESTCFGTDHCGTGIVNAYNAVKMAMNEKIEDIEDYNDNQIDLNIFENEFKNDNYGSCGTISDINKKPPNGQISIILGFAIIFLLSRLTNIMNSEFV
ncbi:MAG: S8 family peptidase [Bdellovibrionales bacterium]|jgi:serine protease|nr:S8 family peptidase [Bdellovibrionales bacterium]